jgi:hypothetical protein
VAGNVRPIRRDIKELRDYLDSLRSFVNSIDGQKSDLPKDANFEMLFEELESLLDGVDEGTTRVKNLMIASSASGSPRHSRTGTDHPLFQLQERSHFAQPLGERQRCQGR